MKDQPGIGLITDDLDPWSCNACVGEIKIGDEHTQMQFRQAYFRICMKCTNSLCSGLISITKLHRTRASRRIPYGWHWEIFERKSDVVVNSGFSRDPIQRSNFNDQLRKLKNHFDVKITPLHK